LDAAGFFSGGSSFSTNWLLASVRYFFRNGEY